MEELANYEQIPTCMCNLRAILETEREDEKVHPFLIGLDETTYGTERSNLLAQDPLPSLNKFYSKIVQEDQMKGVACRTDDQGETMAFAVQGGYSYQEQGEGRNKNVVCLQCKKSRHDAGICN